MPRTHIEITPEQLGALRLEAARRGTRGFSGIVQEALDAYLRELRARRASREGESTTKPSASS
jgi:hypothetical protein